MDIEIPKYIKEVMERVDFYHTLTMTDFVKPPDNVARWESPKQYPPRLGREDYASFLVMSFGMSRGQPLVQRMYTTFLLARTGFDGFEANLAFKYAGGWSCLSLEEQQYLLESFNSVPMHAHKFPANNFYPNHEAVLKKLLTDNLPYLYEKNKDLSWYEKLTDQEMWKLLGQKVVTERIRQFYSLND